jgi:Cu+-exporting ATPase
MLMVKDPVCGMDVDEKEGKFQSEYESRNFYFCSEECQDTFDSQPQNYATQAA